MANLQFTADLIDDALTRVGEPTDGTSDFNAQALVYINRAYRMLWTGGGEIAPEVNEDWLWLKKDPPGVLVLSPLIDDGTVTVTNNNASITFSVAPSSSVAGWFFQVDGDADVFRVATHTGGSTAATLDSVYTGDSGSVTYRLMKLEYTLAADVIKIISPMRIGGKWDNKVDGIDLATLDRDYPINTALGGPPDKFAHVTESKIRFNTFGGEDAGDYIRVEYDYLAKPADLTDSASEEPLVPLQYRQVLSDYAAAMLAADKNDDRGSAWMTQAQAGIRAMAVDNKVRTKHTAFSYGRIYTRPRVRWPRQRLLRTQ